MKAVSVLPKKPS